MKHKEPLEKFKFSGDKVHIVLLRLNQTTIAVAFGQTLRSPVKHSKQYLTSGAGGSKPSFREVRSDLSFAMILTWNALTLAISQSKDPRSQDRQTPRERRGLQNLEPIVGLSRELNPRSRRLLSRSKGTCRPQDRHD